MTPTGEPRRGRWLFRAAVALYVLSFFLPVYRILVGSAPHFGFEVFWDTRPTPDKWFTDPASVIPNVAWTANVSMWLGCVWWVSGRVVRTLACGVMGYLLAFVAGAVYWEVFLSWPGYWTWLGSFVFLAAAGWRARLPAGSDDS